MAAKTTASSGGIYDINITPFVDIVLVLLIIFMISAPVMMYSGMQVALPTIVNGEDMSHVTLNLYLTKDGKYLLDGTNIDLKGVKTAYEKVINNKANGDAIISADKEVAHGKVMELADLLKSMGIQQIGFATLKTGAARVH